MDEAAITVFSQRLSEAKTWCAYCLSQNPQHTLRSPELEPGGAQVDYGFLGWTPEQRLAAVDALAAKRATLLHERKVQMDKEHLTGQVLLFLPDASLSDGAAEVESQGFVNEHNLPAWDTWIAYVEEQGQRLYVEPLWSDHHHNYLLAWVPSQLLDQVNDAIEVNPEQCLLWAKDFDAPILRHSSITDQAGSPSTLLPWGWFALGCSLICDLALLNLCLSYFSVLRSGAFMGSYLDDRGGFWEISSLMPFLVAISLAGGVIAAKCSVSKRMAAFTALMAVALAMLCLILVHFVRTSLR